MSSSSVSELLDFKKYVLPFWVFYIFSVAALITQTGLGLIQPLFYRRLIDDVFNSPNPRDNVDVFLKIVGILLAIRLVLTVLGIVNTIFGTRVTTAATNNLEFDILKKLHAVPMRYHDNHAPGEIFPRLYSDPQQIINFYLNFVPQIFLSFVRIIVVFFIILYHLWWASLIALLPVLPIWIISRFNVKYFRKLSDKQFKTQQKLYTRVLDMLSGIRLVKVFQKSQWEMSRFRDVQSELRELQITAAIRSSWMSPLISSVGRLGGGIVFIAGTARLMNFIEFEQAEFTLGTLFMVLSYVWQLAGPITNFANYSSQFGQIKGAAGRIQELLNEQEISPALSDNLGTTERNSQSVEFKNVSFSYEPGKSVLDNISFKIEPGEVIGLVGPSGSGKTTILNLLCNFYSPDSGKIYISGSSPALSFPEETRPFISIATQSGDLFQGTIRENLCYGRADVTEHELISALELVEASEFTLDLKEGLDTNVGDGARVLSSGQMQRIALARAIIADSQLLILDEATSWVDLWTEQRIFNRLIKNYKDRTIICISHRLHLMKLMNRILVLRDGKLVNQGTHADLIRIDPFYSSSWSLRDFDGYSPE